jgi:CRP-like cAMP-binding protein
VELDRSRAGRRNLLLASLPAKDLALLTPHLKDIVLEQGAVLQEQRERIEQVYFPRDGIVSLAVMRQGEAIETATIGFEGAVGALAGFGSRRAHTRAIVQVKGWASRIAASRFRKIAEENEAVCRIVIRYGEMLLVQVQQTAACNALHPVEARLSRWLLQARDRLESNKINLTHEFLSQMLGVRRTTVTVVAHMLQQAGLIRYHRGRIEIVDWEGLKARSCECYEAIRRNVEEVTPATAR